jgi:hypothetical protein
MGFINEAAKVKQKWFTGGTLRRGFDPFDGASLGFDPFDKLRGRKGSATAQRPLRDRKCAYKISVLILGSTKCKPIASWFFNKYQSWFLVHEM